LISLSAALRLSEEPRVAFVGAGGKTTALFRLARELAGPVLVTTTTHLSVEQLQLADRNFRVQGMEDISTSFDSLSAGINLFTGARSSSGRTAGLDPFSLEKLLALADANHLPLLIEADGSRMLPLKAPADHEPVIPQFVDTVVVVAGMSGLGKPLSGEVVHRMERFGELGQLRLGSIISTPALQKVLLDPQGGIKNIPRNTRRVALLNQVDTPELLSKSAILAGKPYSGESGLLNSYDAVIPAHVGRPLAVYERCAGIVLAAGSSHRWKDSSRNTPKQLAQIGGETLVHRVARTALEAGLDPVILVTGSDSEKVREAVNGLVAGMPAGHHVAKRLKVVYCEDWEQGMSASLKTGLSHIPSSSGSAIFLLADQPFLPVELLKGLIAAHASRFTLIAAPRIHGKRSNPVLFDRRLFPDLNQISGDAGGRVLFEKVADKDIAWVEREDERSFVDIDTFEDFQKAK
jgi:molybdenum cofactor cytidylyltransferase